MAGAVRWLSGLHKQQPIQNYANNATSFQVIQPVHELPKQQPEQETASTTSWYVSKAQAGQRLDRFLRTETRVPQGLIEKLLRKGALALNGNYKLQGNLRVQTGDSIELPTKYTQPSISTQEPRLMEVDPHDAEILKKSVLFKDEDLIAIDKPYGWATQGGHKVAKHIDGMLHVLQDAIDEERPKLVHRLDKDTTGCLLVGRSRSAAARLQEYIRNPDMMKKTYWAFLIGVPQKKQGRINHAIKRITTTDGAERMVLTDDPPNLSKNSDSDWDVMPYYQRQRLEKRNVWNAVTDYKVIEELGKHACLVELEPITGRKHQLRLHCAELLQTPILGDEKYGGPNAVSPPNLKSLLGNTPLRMHLHLRAITIAGWINGRDLKVLAPLPLHIRKTINAFGISSP